MQWLGFTSDGDQLVQVEAETEEAARAAFAAGEFAGQFSYTIEAERYRQRQEELAETLEGRLKPLCHHEAAHAVVGLAVGYRIVRVSMVPTAFNQ